MNKKEQELFETIVKNITPGTDQTIEDVVNHIQDEDPQKQLDEALRLAEKYLDEACAIAEKNSLSFHWDVAYGMGGYYGPNSNNYWDESDSDEDDDYQWQASSQSC